ERTEVSYQLTCEGVVRDHLLYDTLHDMQIIPLPRTPSSSTRPGRPLEPEPLEEVLARDLATREHGARLSIELHVPPGRFLYTNPSGMLQKLLVNDYKAA
ncbi:hypothetical protein KIPB_013717, partial [Kipferlia bialata]